MIIHFPSSYTCQYMLSSSDQWIVQPEYLAGAWRGINQQRPWPTYQGSADAHQRRTIQPKIYFLLDVQYSTRCVFPIHISSIYYNVSILHPDCYFIGHAYELSPTTCIDYYFLRVPDEAPVGGVSIPLGGQYLRQFG